MKSTLILAAAVTAAMSQLSPAQKVPATLPSPAGSELNAAATAGSLQFRSLPAVLDVRERRQDWHKAAQQASERITHPALKDQFNRRISGLVPVVAKALVANPHEDALVTVSVYRDPAKPAAQALIAVTFNGLGGQIGQGFFANVIAGMPKAPDADGIPKNLTLDTEATSYLVFFLGKDQLLAGDIAHPIMGRSVVAMINKQQADQARAVAAAPNVAPRQPTIPPRADQTNANVSTGQTNDSYINANSYPMINDGYYYPTAVGVPIVILPGDLSTPDAIARQRQRQLDLQQRYQNSPYGITAQTNNFVTPQNGNYVTPQSGNYVTPQSGNSVTGGSGNHVSPQKDNRPSGPKEFPKAGEPGGPPANRTAPPQPAKGTPPPGAPGGPPADKDHPQQPANGTPPPGAPGGPPAQKK